MQRKYCVTLTQEKPQQSKPYGQKENWQLPGAAGRRELLANGQSLFDEMEGVMR